MDDLVRQALKDDLIDRYNVVDVWNDDDAEASYRLVFELVKGDEFGLDRAVRYIDVIVGEGEIILYSQNRQSIKVELCDPRSIDQIDEFIVKNCSKRLKSLGKVEIKVKPDDVNLTREDFYYPTSDVVNFRGE